MQIAKTAAAIITILVAIAVLQHSTAWAQGNNAPAFSTISADTQLKYLFPTGAPAKLAFESEPATDAENDPITYRFVFTLPNLETTDIVNDYIKVGPREALFDVSQNGNTFEFEAASGATPHAFQKAYGDVTSYDVPVEVYANDGIADSVRISLILEAVYDPSARFQSPATLQTHNRWEITTPFEIYEGPGAASDIEMQWHATKHSAGRQWNAGVREASPISCYAAPPDHQRPYPAYGQARATTLQRRTTLTANCSQSSTPTTLVRRSQWGNSRSRSATTTQKGPTTAKAR